ncbi:MAG: hypothetical protein JRI25_14715 [Deltaproteobacteria bacterium]|nr:hypothetical protein [Deltaproteobacteria bacterium]
MSCRSTLPVAALLALGFTLACGWPAAEVAERIEEADAPCCSVEDIVKLHATGISDELIIATIRTSQTDLDLTAEQISLMNARGVTAEVIDVLNGGPCVCEEVPEPVAEVPKEGPPPLNVTVKYSGGRSFELINLSQTQYTGLTLVINGEYQYRLKRLPAGGNDNIRLVTFVSRRTGEELKPKLGMNSLTVTADQGAWSKSF